VFPNGVFAVCAVRSAGPWQIALATLTLAAAFAAESSAGLIVDALSYDGSVRSGSTTGVEEHSTTTNFPPPNASIPLPAINGPLSPPLAASKNLTMTFTTASEQFPVPGGPLYDTAIIQISSPTGNVFANSLDNTLLFPVELEARLYSDQPGKKLVLDPGNIGIENFDLPPFQSPMPGSYSVSGLGTATDPLHVTLRMTAGQVDDLNGFVKLHLRFGEMVVPEPGSFLLFGAGGLALGGSWRTRRRRSCQTIIVA
jgi:hypothetical protein